ncbi:hypothetical protein L873DRAFT_1810825 [Choiromyces venosus 120613-1]|uniref:Uncharacterized protein n=1 Tax=Choiromyces venosus 120613-1 TaxID=1336337 RepID=A0A3N4JHP1_9PEZI|nr:hypothetical protein L873DRAFT_1810825 [Choiromyces venosus 120613-1]
MPVSLLPVEPAGALVVRLPPAVSPPVVSPVVTKNVVTSAQILSPPVVPPVAEEVVELAVPVVSLLAPDPVVGEPGSTLVAADLLAVGADDNAGMESVGESSVAASTPIGVAAVGQPTFGSMVAPGVYGFSRGGMKMLTSWIVRAMSVGWVSLTTAIWSDASHEYRMILAPRLLTEGWRFRDLVPCDCCGVVEGLGEFVFGFLLWRLVCGTVFRPL